MGHERGTACGRTPWPLPVPRPKPLRTLIWNSARASSSGAGLFAGMQIGVRILQLEAARRIADRQGYVDIISIRPQGRWTAHLVLNSPVLADMASTSCSISDRFILNDHRPMAVRPKAGARAKKQLIQSQATDCHVEVCDPEVTTTSSRPAVGLGDKTLLTLERLDQSCAICSCRTGRSFEGHVVLFDRHCGAQ